MFWKKKVENTQKYNVKIITYEREERIVENCIVVDAHPQVLKLLRTDGYAVIRKKDIHYFEAKKVVE